MLLLLFAGADYRDNGSLRRPQWVPAMANPAKIKPEADEDEDEALIAVAALLSAHKNLGHSPD